MKTFEIPSFYRSSVISAIKNLRKIKDPKKKDLSPTLLDFGPLRIIMGRHFGFCYGVENAVEIAYKALDENPGKKIYLLSQMIHNPDVNADLVSRGVSFLMDTKGKKIIDWNSLKSEDIVIIPAFGTTVEIENELSSFGVEPLRYNTTCPFVERVWKKSEKLGAENCTIIIHGKPDHEETRATFSRSSLNAPSLVIKDLKEAALLGKYIAGEIDEAEFKRVFTGRMLDSFDPKRDLNRIGVINQTTMLAVETQEIADYLKNVMLKKHGASEVDKHFADTRDTLCYATNENQDSTYSLLQEQADLAIVVGGYNSSNTSHLVELCEQKFKTYFISSAVEIDNSSTIHHFNWRTQQRLTTENFLPEKNPLTIILTSGASCPDAIIEAVILKLVSFFDDAKPIDELVKELASEN